MIRSARALTLLTSTLAAVLAAGVGCPAPEHAYPCASDRDCDDARPCTDQRCQAGSCVYADKPQGTTCGPGGLTCDDRGRCAGCTADDQCGASSACMSAACADHECIVTDMVTPPDTQHGDCLRPSCDANGALVDAPDPSDVPDDDGDPCTDEVCGDTGPAHVLSASGKSCGPGDAHCDDTGSCVSCADGVQDGDEEDVDCGGACPLRCGGADCEDGSVCQSGGCRFGQCLSAIGGACTDNAACVTSLCSAYKCAPCSTELPCPGGAACDAGACKAPWGAPCVANADCGGGLCNPATSLCQKGYGADCAAGDQCDSGWCNALGAPQVCASCTDNSQCYAAYGGLESHVCVKQVGATYGNCALPKGAYCSPGYKLCAPGLTCKGFPLRCLL